jgi:hypothetical protein
MRWLLDTTGAFLIAALSVQPNQFQTITRVRGNAGLNSIIHAIGSSYRLMTKRPVGFDFAHVISWTG